MDDNLQTIHVKNKQEVVEGITFLISVSSYLIHTMKDKFFIQHSTIIYHPISPILKAFKQFVCLCLWLFWDFFCVQKYFFFWGGGMNQFWTKTFSPSEWHHIALLQNSQDYCNWLTMPLHRIDHVLAIELRFGLWTLPKHGFWAKIKEIHCEWNEYDSVPKHILFEPVQSKDGHQITKIL